MSRTSEGKHVTDREHAQVKERQSTMAPNPTVVFQRPGEVILEERAVPAPGAGELLIKTRCTLISTGTELTILTGDFRPDSAWSAYGRRFPFLPGYNNVGDVIELGAGVDRHWLGRRVATYGCHARYVSAAASDARVIPAPVRDEHAVFFTIAEIVMNGVRRGNVQWGESAVIFGLGLLGQLAVRVCQLCGARPIVAVDVAESRLQRLPDDPAVFPVDGTRDDVPSVVDDATRGRKADVVFEVTGNPESIPAQVPLLHSLGRLVVLSSPWGETRFDFHDLCNGPSISIIGAHNGSHPAHATVHTPWTQHRHAELFFDLVADGKLEMEPLISHRAQYGQAPELYAMLTENRSSAMGVILEWAG